MNLATRSTILLFMLSLSVLTAWSQVPNGGFENWTGGNPDNWSVPLNFLYHNVTQSSTAHSGSSSIRGEMLDSTKNVLFQAGAAATGFGISGRPASFSGYYQFNPVSGDRLYTSVLIMKAWTGAALGTVIGTGLISIDGATSGWTKFTVPITYTTNDAPNGAVMNFMMLPPAAGGAQHVGSYFLVDDLTLDGATDVNDIANIPAPSFKLNDNYPNPFNPTTNISFNVPVESHVTLEVLNVLGQQVAMLENNDVPPGSYQRTWNGNGASGVYFYRLQAVGVNDSRVRFTEMKKMILAK